MKKYSGVQGSADATAVYLVYQYVCAVYVMSKRATGLSVQACTLFVCSVANTVVVAYVIGGVFVCTGEGIPGGGGTMCSSLWSWSGFTAVIILVLQNTAEHQSSLTRTCREVQQHVSRMCVVSLVA